MPVFVGPVCADRSIQVISLYHYPNVVEQHGRLETYCALGEYLRFQGMLVEKMQNVMTDMQVKTPEHI